MRDRMRWAIGTAAAAILAGTLWYGWLDTARLDAASSAIAEPPVARPVPVTGGAVEIRDFPIYRIGIGTVQAYNTVTVRVRVDGEVQTIAFQKGQDVRAGDLLAEIDPRTYEAQLHQAQ